MIISIIEKIEIMFEQYCVHHNCSKNDDMKNITRPCSCDFSFGEKACPRETSYCNTGISSTVNTKCISKYCNKSERFESNFDIRYGSESESDLTYHSNVPPQYLYNNSKSTSRSYPAWFERTVRYLFSKQLRKCFDLA